MDTGQIARAGTELYLLAMQIGDARHRIDAILAHTPGLKIRPEYDGVVGTLDDAIYQIRTIAMDNNRGAQDEAIVAFQPASS